MCSSMLGQVSTVCIKTFIIDNLHKRRPDALVGRPGLMLVTHVRNPLRRAPTAHRKPPPTVRGLWGERALQRLPPQLPLPRGRDESPPRMGGVSTPPISLITPFLRDINHV